MRYAAFGLSLLIAMAVSTAGRAQLKCQTSSVVCNLATGVAGSPCYCATPSGPIQGIAEQAGGGAPASLPQFCCTPGGRFGFNNSSARPGQDCQAMTPKGRMVGQACF